MKINHTKVTAAVDTGMTYWYLFKHGLGPGTMPRGVNVLKVIEDGWKDYVLLDKMLTTEELNMYEIKEKMPPQELLDQAGYSEVDSACDVNAASAIAEIPAPFDQWYQIDNNSEASEFGSPAEEIEGYEAKHLAWAVAKDEYYDALANNGIEYCELVSEGDGEPFLAYVAGDRLYPVSEDEVLQCIESEEDLEFSTDVEASQPVEASWDNPNIFDFYGWYNNLTLKQRHQVDDWCDEWGYPLYDDCSREDLSAIHDHFESEFAQANETNFHVVAFGNDFNELQDSIDTDDPKKAILTWLKWQGKYPMDVMITGYAKGEQILRDYVTNHSDWFRAASAKSKSPYDPEYIISECAKPSRMKPSEYTDQLHPFGLG